MQTIDGKGMQEIHGDEAVIQLLRTMGLFEAIQEVQPNQGVLVYEADSTKGARIFLARFVNGHSLGWVCYDMPGACLTDAIAAFVRERIEKTYRLCFNNQVSIQVNGSEVR